MPMQRGADWIACMCEMVNDSDAGGVVDIVCTCTGDVHIHTAGGII
jgi:hypothetical protein